MSPEDALPIAQTNQSAGSALARRIVDVVGNGPPEAEIAKTIHAIAPQDGLEEMLVAQIIVAHKASLRFLARTPEASLFGIANALPLAVKLSRLMAEHVKLLRKCRPDHAR